MQNINRNPLILASALFLLFIAPACYADLMCYVCDDCATLQKDAPLLACNEDYFNQGGSTEASTVTTTTSATTEITAGSSTTDATTTPATETTSETVTTTEVPETTTTMELTTDQSTETTGAPMPTPPTVGPPETTVGVPTPPIEGLRSLEKSTHLVPVDVLGNAAQEISTTTELPIRQRRALIDTSVSYHCYTVQRTINNTTSTERGCSRVTPLQSVCQELEVLNNDVQLANCDPCSMNACNGATATLQSSLLATLLIAAVAAAMQRN